MRYANFAHNGKTINSIGDQMQILAIDYLYEKMGISLNEVIYINKDDLRFYDGEEVILPVAFPLFDYCEGGLQNWFSKKIKPIFLGHTIFKDSLSNEEVIFYRKHEPIGCRDERMYNTLSKYGINCYLMGCMTAIFAKRNTSIQTKKIFLVDSPDSLEPYIPEDLKPYISRYTHFVKGNHDIKKIAKERYDFYKQEASLIVTSLLHCAVPCIAAGIPTIITKSNFSYRFAWLESLSKIYLEQDFENIDWDIKAIDYEEHKELLVKVAIDRIKGLNKFEEINKIHNFYMNRAKQEYTLDAFSSIKKYIDGNWIDRNFNYKYSIWGLTQIAEVVVSYISANYPNAELINVYDKYRKILFQGVESRPPLEDLLIDDLNFTVFVTAQTAREEAIELFSKINKSPQTYVFSEVSI